MAGADASIYGLLRQQAPARGPMDDYAQGMQIRHMLDQGDLAQMQRSKLMREMDEEEAFKAALRGSGVVDEATVGRLMSVSPSRAMALQKQMLEGRKTQADIGKAQAETAAKVVDTYRNMLGGVNDQQAFSAWRAALVRDAPGLAAWVPEVFSPQTKLDLLMKAEQLVERLSPRLDVRDTGGTLQGFNPYTATPVGPATAKTATPDALLTDERTRSEGALNRGTQVAIAGKPQWDSERGVFVVPPPIAGGGGAPRAPAPSAGAATANPAAGMNPPSPPPPGARVIKPDGPMPPRSGDVSSLRKEFNALPEVQNYRAVVPIINSAMNAPDNKAGDIQFAYTIGKIFDPNSVVREGELALVGQAANVMEKYKGELQALVYGKGRLTAQTRAELLAAARARAEELKRSYDQAKTTYSRQAQASGLPQDQIFMDVEMAPAARAPAAPQGPTRRINNTNYVKINGQWYEQR